MRLIDTTILVLREFLGVSTPEYAILSHTWGNDELRLQDLEAAPDFPDSVRAKAGFAKVKRFCEISKSNGYQWAWCDTCCIDKTSSSELSEAINSMFNWYKGSHVCYAYLADVDVHGMLQYRGNDPMGQWNVALQKSRWFKRGWTLQELIAPRDVEFLDANWTHFASKENMSAVISDITRICRDALAMGFEPSRYCAATRMSWAALRATAREEDQAYCLLGLFNINMPLLYGEGGSRAFRRLVEEIILKDEDFSLLAWDRVKFTERYRDGIYSPGEVEQLPGQNILKIEPLFPESTSSFMDQQTSTVLAKDFRPTSVEELSKYLPTLKSSTRGFSQPPSLTSKMLHVDLCCIDAQDIGLHPPCLQVGMTTVYAFLNCTSAREDLVCLILEGDFLDAAKTTMSAVVLSPGIVLLDRALILGQFHWRRFLIQRTSVAQNLQLSFEEFLTRCLTAQIPRVGVLVPNCSDPKVFSDWDIFEVSIASSVPLLLQVRMMGQTFFACCAFEDFISVSPWLDLQNTQAEALSSFSGNGPSKLEGTRTLFSSEKPNMKPRTVLKWLKLASGQWCKATLKHRPRNFLQRVTKSIDHRQPIFSLHLEISSHESHPPYTGGDDYIRPLNYSPERDQWVEAASTISFF
jgi:hypothetical protein